jgi:GGDEF domain-containing protein
LVVHVRDVSNLRSLEQALREASHLDQQTGLANREGLRRAGELTPDAGAMIVIELGWLAAIGDLHGPDLAEIVVVEAAGTSAHLSAWAGLSDLSPDADIDEVVRRAGLAMRSVRAGPPGAVEWYDE